MLGGARGGARLAHAWTTSLGQASRRSLSATRAASAAAASPESPVAEGVPTDLPRRVLITGACGQIGSELIPYMRRFLGDENVLASDIKRPAGKMRHFHYLDVLDVSSMHRLVVEEEVDTVVHLGAVLSAVGERNPDMALRINGRGTENVLELARQHSLRVYVPSSIAAFGPTTPLDCVPDITIQRPTTMYGVNKVAAELLAEYYHHKFGVDYRALRYPGIISSATAPGGGTTDYAVEIFYEAITKGRYTSFLGPESLLPMMYMPDCLKSTTAMLFVDRSALSQCTYNIAAVSFTPAQLAESIKKVIPDFEISYKPDFRQAIADSWPKVLDDTRAREDWQWRHDFDLDGMCADMIERLRQRGFKREE